MAQLTVFLCLTFVLGAVLGRINRQEIARGHPDFNGVGQDPVPDRLTHGRNPGGAAADAFGSLQRPMPHRVHGARRGEQGRRLDWQRRRFGNRMEQQASEIQARRSEMHWMAQALRKMAEHHGGRIPHGSAVDNLRAQFRRHHQMERGDDHGQGFKGQDSMGHRGVPNFRQPESYRHPDVVDNHFNMMGSRPGRDPYASWMPGSGRHTLDDLRAHGRLRAHQGQGRHPFRMMHDFRGFGVRDRRGPF